MNARVQGFAAEHCTVKRGSMLLTSSNRDFNVVADQCMCSGRYQTKNSVAVILLEVYDLCVRICTFENGQK